VPHAPLPFADHAFDIVYSNAVLEHAGSAEQQRFFLSELCRVTRRRFVAVPNRWFPVEHHTGLPLINYLPKATFRRLLSKTRYAFWSHEANLNYVSADELRKMWPDGTPEIAYSGIGVGMFQSHLVAYSG
jgi:SAM-dependent methyltransferase